MSAPALWILVPFIAAVVALFIPNERANAILGGATALLLSAVAMFIPIDSALLIGPIFLKISPTIQMLGRNLKLGAADGAVLAIVYGMAALWFFGSQAAGAS